MNVAGLHGNHDYTNEQGPEDNLSAFQAMSYVWPYLTHFRNQLQKYRNTSSDCGIL